jgi:signal transduction histidine kinase
MARRILLADDDPAQLELAAHVIRSLDFEVFSASDGASAFEQIRQHRVQLAVLDWMMPELSGVEVCRRLKELPWIVHSIILTAHGTKEDVATALEAGASDYLVKPFNPGELRARLQVGVRILALQEHVTHTQKMESIGQLAAGVAHEINTPAQFVSHNLLYLRDATSGMLHAVDALVEVFKRLSRDEPISAELMQKTESVLNEVELDYARDEIPLAIGESIDGIQRVADIVQAMKQFSHPVSVQRVFVNLNDSIEKTATISRGEWKTVADLDLDLDPELPEVECVPGEMSQVLLNLIVNAAHAIAELGADDEQKGKIAISTRAQGDRVTIAISDTGKGIPPEIRSRIFEPFFTTKEVGKGTGQGLAVAYEIIVRQHRGTIEFESELGRGTTFKVCLPVSSTFDLDESS